MENKIYVLVTEDNTAIFKFPKYNIETIAYIGRNGVTNIKKEGDGKTPLGEFELGIALGTHPREEIQIDTNYKQITTNMYWVDDPTSKFYNKLVDSLSIKKDWCSAEHLIDYPIQYEYLIEIKTNPKNIAGNGSAIFLHCSNNTPTAGCIAIDRKTMKSIIESIDKQTKITISI